VHNTSKLISGSARIRAGLQEKKEPQSQNKAKKNPNVLICTALRKIMVREILTGGSHRVICNLINGRTRILPADPPLEFAYLPVLGDKQSGFKLKYVVAIPASLSFFFRGLQFFETIWSAGCRRARPGPQVVPMCV
jgi:hypothetical protein